MDSASSYLSRGEGVSFGEVVSDIESHMGIYGDYAEVTNYNPFGSEVPHVVVLLETPKAGADIPKFRCDELRSINMVLKNPEFVYRPTRRQIDFEPTYESVLAHFNLPLPVLERQNIVYINNPRNTSWIASVVTSTAAALDCTRTNAWLRS